MFQVDQFSIANLPFLECTASPSPPCCPCTPSSADGSLEPKPEKKLNVQWKYKYSNHLNTGLVWYSVVSTVMSGILFACFPLVDYVCFPVVDYVTHHSCSFLFMTSSLFQKIPVETESSLSRGKD